MQPNRSILYGPTPEQRERDPFVNTFGLFAGMVIEAEDVEVDMCGHTMTQAERFIQAQAFYYPIFLGSQVFPVPGEAFKPARRVLIHNGRIRNVGHFCIGMWLAEDVRLENMRLQRYAVGGLSAFGCSGRLWLHNVRIGPQRGGILANASFNSLVVQYRNGTIPEPYAARMASAIRRTLDLRKPPAQFRNPAIHQVRGGAAYGILAGATLAEINGPAVPVQNPDVPAPARSLRLTLQRVVIRGVYAAPVQSMGVINPEAGLVFKDAINAALPIVQSTRRDGTCKDNLSLKIAQASLPRTIQNWIQGQGRARYDETSGTWSVNGDTFAVSATTDPVGHTLKGGYSVRALTGLQLTVLSGCHIYSPTTVFDAAPRLPSSTILSVDMTHTAIAATARVRNPVDVYAERAPLGPAPVEGQQRSTQPQPGGAVGQRRASGCLGR